MKVEIKIPSMGESVSEAVISSLLRSSGELVHQDDEILEMETDKVNQVLYAPESGKLELTVSEEETVSIGQVVGSIDTSVKPEAKPALSKELPAAKLPEKDEASKEILIPKGEVPKKETPVSKESSSTGARVFEQAFISGLHTAPAIQDTVSSHQEPPKSTRKKMSKIRRVIADRLVQSKNQSAMLTTFNEVDMTAIMEMRKTYQEKFIGKYDIKLGFMSFFVKAVVHGLNVVPELNSMIDGEEIVQHHTANIGIAVGTDRGLVVPVLRSCETMSFAEVEKGIIDYAVKARKGGLKADDMVGGHFTITNGGIYGSLLSTPILNPPQSGILGMHSIQKRAVVVDDQIVIRPMMYLAMSYDHRIIDGKEAVTFLVTVKEALEDPKRLLVEV